MSLKFFRLNSNGLSLVSTLVAAGILGILALGFSQLVFNSMVSQKTVDVRFLVTELEKDLINSLEEASICSYNWGATANSHSDLGRPARVADIPLNITKINNLDSSGNNVTKFTTTPPNNVYQTQLKIIRIALENFSLAGAPPSDKGLLDFIIEVEAVGAIYGSQKFRKRLPVKVVLSSAYPTNPNPQVQSCQVVGSPSSNLWTLNPDSSIYYSDQVYSLPQGGSLPSSFNMTDRNFISHTPQSTLYAKHSKWPGFNIIHRKGAIGGYPVIRFSTADGVEGAVSPTTTNPNGLIGALIWAARSPSRGSPMVAQVEAELEQNMSDTEGKSSLVFSTGDAMFLNPDGRWQSAAERVRITSAGDVGVGTTTPGYKLHVNGSVAGIGGLQ